MNYEKLEQVKKIIDTICSDCLVFPLCSKICIDYFNAVDCFLNRELCRENWLISSKSVCDEAVDFIVRSKI